MASPRPDSYQAARASLRKTVRIAADPAGEIPATSGYRDRDDTPVEHFPMVRLDGLRVLVVDDEAHARRVLGMVLEEVGAIVTAVSSAHEAMEVLAEAHPDVLISDLGMPDQDGFDLIRQVRAHGYDAKKLPAVALSAFVHRNDARLALLAGFQIHVPKPVEPQQLTSVIASLAGRPG